MSVKNVQKQEKSKKASDVHSLRHDDKSTQSFSSLSSHHGDLWAKSKKLEQKLIQAQQKIIFHRRRMDKYRGTDDKFFKDQVQDAEGELQLWQSTWVQIKAKLKVVENQMREMFGSPDKSQKKKNNFALRKVEEPPSDNQ